MLATHHVAVGECALKNRDCANDGGDDRCIRRVFALKFQAGEIALFIPWRGWQPRVRRIRRAAAGRSVMASAAPAQTDNYEGRNHCYKPSDPDRYAESDEALHDQLAGHCANRRARYPRCNECEQEHARCPDAEQRRQCMIGCLDLRDFGSRAPPSRLSPDLRTAP